MFKALHYFYAVVLFVGFILFACLRVPAQLLAVSHGKVRPLALLLLLPFPVLVFLHYAFFIISCVFIGHLFGWLCLGHLVRVFLAPVCLFGFFFLLLFFMCRRLRALVNSLGQYHCKCFYRTAGTILCQTESELN